MAKALTPAQIKRYERKFENIMARLSGITTQAELDALGDEFDRIFDHKFLTPYFGGVNYDKYYGASFDAFMAKQYEIEARG